MPYKIVEDIAIADVCYDLSGSTLEELFESGFKALMETMVDLSTVKTVTHEIITINSQNEEKLLFEFLEELVFRKDAETMIYRTCEVKIITNNEKNEFQLTAKLRGQQFDESISTITDVKAITYYQYYVKKKGNIWIARVTFDL